MPIKIRAHRCTILSMRHNRLDYIILNIGKKQLSLGWRQNNLAVAKRLLKNLPLHSGVGLFHFPAAHRRIGAPISVWPGWQLNATAWPSRKVFPILFPWTGLPGSTQTAIIQNDDVNTGISCLNDLTDTDHWFESVNSKLCWVYLIRCLIDIITISATEMKSKGLSLKSFNKSGKFGGKLYFGSWLIFGSKEGKNKALLKESQITVTVL